MLAPVTDTLLVVLVGMASVFASLSLLALLIWAVRSADEALNARRIRSYAATVSELPEEEINDELVAVVAAAAMAAIKQPLEVRRMRFLGPETGRTWAATGRLTIMGSHAVQRKRG
jgi:Na+-transporting methylmalonyl-CoA/oxaloacetate decarboxylase gamma subunit